MMKKLFTTRYGSFLYGTHTATSDVDLKHVVLPPLDDLLLGKKVQNAVKKTNTEKFTKNSAEDVDEEFIPLQVFANDFLGGQTYAFELAYAVDFNQANQVLHDRLFKGFCAELRNRFLTSNMSALVGYAVNQASLYSFKGERLNAVRAAKSLYEKWAQMTQFGETPENHSLAFGAAAADLEVLFPKYFQVTEYAVDSRGTMRPCVKLLEKVLPYSRTFEDNLTTVNTHLKKYGSRADAASVDNVDWKATMHALRVVDEGISLLKNKRLSFPFEPSYVEFLLQVKRGEHPYEGVTELLNTRLEELKTLEAMSTLPKKTHALQEQLDVWLLEWLRLWYELPYSI